MDDRADTSTERDDLEDAASAERSWRNLFAALALIAVVGIILFIAGSLLAPQDFLGRDSLPWERELIMADLESGVRGYLGHELDTFVVEYEARRTGGWIGAKTTRFYRGGYTVTGSGAQLAFLLTAEDARRAAGAPDSVYSVASIAAPTRTHHAFSHEEIGGPGRLVELARQYDADFGAERFDYEIWSATGSYEPVAPVVADDLAMNRLLAANSGDAVVVYAVMRDSSGTEQRLVRGIYRWLEAGRAWELVFADQAALR